MSAVAVICAGGQAWAKKTPSVEGQRHSVRHAQTITGTSKRLRAILHPRQLRPFAGWPSCYRKRLTGRAYRLFL